MDKGQNLDIFSGQPAGNGQPRRLGQFLGVHFLCCDIYARIYPNHKRTAYVGNCPRCAKPIHIRIGSGGTTARFFTAE